MRREGLLATVIGGAWVVLYGACGGKVVVDESVGGAGAAGPGNSSVDVSGPGPTTSVNVSAGPSVVTAVGPSVVASVGSGPEPGCVSCAEYISQPGMSPLCPGSEAIYDALFFCVCAKGCVPQCSDNVCVGGDATGDCTGCLQKVCGNEFNNCANDI